MKEDANEMKSNGTLTKEPSESGAHYNIFDANYGAWLTSIGQERAILTDEDIADYRNKMNPCLYVADSLEELAEALDLDLSDEDLDYDTLGGLVFSQLSVIPDDGSRPIVEALGLRIQVEELCDRRVEWALVEKLEQQVPTGEPAPNK